MAKRLLLSILVDVLGSYVEGLTVENLKLGVWSGKLEFSNLRLKRNALDGLNLPISVSHGSLNHLSVKIPWTALESKPVKVVIDGIYLQAGPLDLSKLDSEEIRKRILQTKRAKLQEAEDLIMISGEEKDVKDGQKSSYFRNLAMKIVDNIEISITNIHIRYEDNRISIPNRCLSAGLTISSIKLSTTDDQWKEAFIIRGTGAGKDSISDIIRKLGILEHLGIYWNVNESNPMNDMSHSEWLENMKKMIFKSNDMSSNLGRNVDFLISPPSVLTLKIVHRPKSTVDIPKIDLTISSTTLFFNFDRLQYQQILGVAASFTQLERYKQMAVYRPRVRPTVDARAWWKYAYKLVLGKDLSVANKIDIMIKCKKKRERYILLVKQAKKSKAKHPNNTPPEDAELNEIEDSLPFQSLLMFRKVAAVEMIKEKNEDLKPKKNFFGLSPSRPATQSTRVVADQKKPAATQLESQENDNPVAKMGEAGSRKSSRIGFLSSWGKKSTTVPAAPSTTVPAVIKAPTPTASAVPQVSQRVLTNTESPVDDDEEEDYLLIDKIQSQFLADDNSADEFPVRILLETATEIHITSSKESIVDIAMSMRAYVEVKPQRILLTFSLGSVIVEDKFSIMPTEKYLVKPQTLSNNKNPQQFCVQIETFPLTSATNITVKTIPFDFTFNNSCLQQIFEIVMYKPPTIQSTSGSNKSQMLKALSSYAKEITSGKNKGVAKTVTINIDIDSPTIIIPRSSKSDLQGYLLLDCGHFNMNGCVALGGVKFDALVKGINVGMPDSTRQRYELQARGLYLVNPFDVQLGIQNFDKTKAELGLDIKITPSIRADIDVEKLRRLIAIILTVTKTITNATTKLKEEEVVVTEDFRSSIMNFRDSALDFKKQFLQQILADDTQSETVSDSPSISTYGSSGNLVSAVTDQRKDLFLSISIQSIAIIMTLSPGHHVDCIADGIVIAILLSPFETTVSVDLKAITIYDSLRPKPFDALVWTPAAEAVVASENRNLCHLNMIFFSKKDSSLYRGYGSEISIDFMRLGLDLDDLAILRLCPFFRELTKDYDLEIPKPQSQTPRNSALGLMTDRLSLSSPPSSAVASNDFASLRLDITMAIITLNMIKERKSIGYERLFGVNIGGFVLQYEFVERADMKMAIKNLDGVDTRSESRNYYYKNIFCRSNLASEYASATEKKKTKDEDTEWLQSNSNLTADESEKIFFMTYLQESATVAGIDITVTDVTGFISPDSLLTFVNVLMANVSALIQLIGAMTASSKKKKQSADNSNDNFLLKMIVRVNNPRLLVLEDPREQDTQAIVSKCGIVLHFITETENGIAKESLHLSLSDFEIFVLQGLSIGFPQQIVDPTSIEFHMKRSVEKSIVLSAQFSVNVDSINMKISFHDLILMNAIMTRTIEIATTMDIVSNSTSNEVTAVDYSEGVASNLTMYDVMVQLRLFAVTIINDYGRQNLPVLRLQIADTQVQASGAVVLMNGDASFIISADYYNTRVTCYEPILEPWCPNVSLTTDLSSILVEVFNDNTLQLDISGELARSLIDCSYLFKAALGEYKREHSTWKRNSIDLSSISPQLSPSSKSKTPSVRVKPVVPHELSNRLKPTEFGDKFVSEDNPVMFVNTLGIPISIYEHRTKTHIASLDGTAKKAIDRITLLSVFDNRKSVRNMQVRLRELSNRLPSLYDVVIMGGLDDLYLPLYQLPLNVNVPRHYYLQLKPSQPSITENSSIPRSPSGTLVGAKESTNSRVQIYRKHSNAHSSVVVDPVVEEVFQNSRYDVVNRRWSKTWYKYGDPDEWTDRKNHTSAPPNEKALPSDEWEWVEPEWRVDMDGVIGKDIDEEGYEYNINFNNFTVKKRRTFQPLDSVRRRRWIRTRRMIPTQTVQSSESSPRSSQKRGSVSVVDNENRFLIQSSNLIPIFWDVQLQPDGCRNVIVRTDFSVVNSMPFSIEIKLSYPDDTHFHYGPIASNETYYVPLRRIHAKMIEIRPSILNGFEFDWSTALDCRIRTPTEKKTQPTESLVLYFIDCVSQERKNLFDEDDRPRSPIRIFMRVSIDFTSDKGVRVECMPFAVIYNRLPCSFAFKCTSDHNIEHGVIQPASQHPLIHVNPTVEPMLSIQLGSYIWSSPKSFEAGNQIVDLVSPFKSTEGINVTMSVTTNPASGLFEISIYSKYALIDRTGLNMSIRTRRFNDKQVPFDLSGNHNAASTASNMTSVTGTTIDSQSLFMDVGNTIERRTYDDLSYDNSTVDPMDSWTTGAHGVTLFQSANDTAILGFNRGKVWSFTISLLSLGSNMRSLEVFDKEAKKVYQLGFQISPLPYIFQETHGLVVTPWYRIVNCTDESIEIRQVVDDKNKGKLIPSQQIRPMMTEGWHRSEYSKDTRMHFKTRNSLWSLGSVDINEIGTTVLLIPIDPEIDPHGASDNSAITANLLHIEVKFAEPDDYAYMVMLIWKEALEPRDKWTISVKNTFKLPITLRQDMKEAVTDPTILSKYEMCIEPGQWIPFGWGDQSISSNVLACVGTTMAHIDTSQCVSIDMLKVGEPCFLSLQDISSEFVGEFVQLVVQAIGSGKVLHISESKGSSKLTQQSSQYEIPYRKEFKLYLRSLGISLNAERPVRREFLSLYLEEIEADIIMKDATKTEAAKNFFEFKIHDIQIDNYSETAVYPTILHSYDSATRKKATKRARYKNKGIRTITTTTTNSATDPASSDSNTPETLHFLQVMIIQERPLGLETTIFKYVAFRVLELKASIDSSTIQLYLLDIHNDIIGETMNQDQFKGLSSTATEQWVESYNVYMTSQFDNPVNPIEAKKLGQGYKIYLETLVIHPIKITASFMTTPFPREQKFDILASKKFRWLQFIRGIAGFEEVTIKMNSFIVKNVMESKEALKSRLTYKITKELQSQMIGIAGNLIGQLNVIGKPAGLYKNIGSGVEDFFYEPYQGLMQSPQDFVAGVGRGAGYLIQGVGRGVITSAAAVVGTASSTVAKGATYLTGDEKFAKDREDRRREQSVSGGGVMAGIKAGGESVFTGFKSGFSGLITKPIEEGRKSGASGFIKGVGLGVVGAAVKPIMGITDGIASVTQGITNSVSDNVIVTHARPPRAFDRSPSDERDLILVTLNLAAAQAQYSVINWAKKDNLRDEFLAYINLGYHDSGSNQSSGNDVHAIILSARYVYLIKQDGSLVWKSSFGTISYCQYLGEFNTVRLVMYQSNQPMRPGSFFASQTPTNIDIQCRNQSYALQAYSILATYSNRMGNPSNVIPVELLFKDSKPFDIANVPQNDDKEKLLSVTTKPIDTDLRPIKSKSKKFNYKFGSNNQMTFPIRSKVTSSMIINDAAKRFSEVLGTYEHRNLLKQRNNQIPSVLSLGISYNPNQDEEMTCLDSYMRSVDERCLQLIQEWTSLHTGLKASRCLLGILINTSSDIVKISSIDIKEGKSFQIFSVKSLSEEEGYDSKTHTLQANGIAVVFACGKFPTIVDSAHVKLRIQSTGFVALLSSRPIGTTCEGFGGFTVGFLEKTLTEWWSKHVLLIA